MVLTLNANDVATYMTLAQSVAERSKATRLKVGAVIVNPNRVAAFGYNGTPAGWDNSCEAEGVTLPEVIHAEINAIFKFVQSGLSTKDCLVFLTHSPCLECAKVIFLSGISHLVFADEYRSDAGIIFLKRAGVEVTKYK